MRVGMQRTRFVLGGRVESMFCWRNLCSAVRTELRLSSRSGRNCASRYASAGCGAYRSACDSTGGQFGRKGAAVDKISSAVGRMLIFRKSAWSFGWRAMEMQRSEPVAGLLSRAWSHS